MTQIRSLFDPGKDIYRTIEKVITYQASQEERLKAEISEYIVTESIEQQLEQLLEKMQAAMEAGGETRDRRLGVGLLRLGQELVHQVSRSCLRRAGHDRRQAVPPAPAGSAAPAAPPKPCSRSWSRSVSPPPSSCSIWRASRSPVRRSPRSRPSSTTRSCNMPATPGT